MSDFKKTPLTDPQKKTINQHLEFINYVSIHSLKHGIRTIVGGGYAVDGAIGEISRPHDDIDIQLYGKHFMNPILLKEYFLAEKYEGLNIEDQGRKEFYHTFFVSGLGVEIYYIQVATNPFTDSHIILKSDGTYAEEQDFMTKTVFLNGVRFEAQNAVVELADKIYKREHRGDPKKEKHEQDIFNLRLITDFREVDDELHKLHKLAESGQ